ncbi:DNA polymerase III subunit chi [Kordiimonas aestuarii]|uniref:DNA polymerase III subunit chi n=1 Tax=Kordiimonas aestuarii TaxID=1005925 RepID=UPI0021D0ED94|nr:DNA polymerase III subunit chi [Kordiimonas aestuarii]
MAEIRFYHLQRQTLEEALPKLMERVVEAGLRAVVKLPERGMMETLNKVLWDYDAASFLPHDIEGCESPEDQTIFLTTGDHNPNAATVLVLVDAVKSPDVKNYDRCLYMFDGRDEGIVGAAREDWKVFKDYDVDMSYWQQREMGGWEQKA